MERNDKIRLPALISDKMASELCWWWGLIEEGEGQVSRVKDNEGL